MDDRTVRAVILGVLIPELEYASPVLLDRLDAGLPLIERRSPSDLGFETGSVDPQLLDLFRTLAPFVTAAAGILQSWLVHNRGRKSQEEWQTAVSQLRVHDAELRQALASIGKALSDASTPVTQAELDEAIADAMAHLARTQS